MKECFIKVLHPKTMHEQWMSEQFKPGLVSVIMPTYNRADLIEETLDSVWRQTYRPIELLVVDDGSTDCTSKVVKEWSCKYGDKKDFCIRCFYQDNAGPSSARNYGLVESHGEFIQFLDSDDIIHKERLKKVVDLFLSSSCEFIETGFEGFCPECGEGFEKHYGHTITDAVVLLLIGRLGANTLRSTFHRSLVVRTGPWNEAMICFEDYEYVARAIMLSRKNMAIHDILASARRGGGPRLSDRMKTHEGRAFRINCEEVICELIRDRDDISLDAKHTFVSRLYSLGLRSNARGWADLGYRCFVIADSLRIGLDNRTKLKRLICRMGKYGGLVYKNFYGLRNTVLGENDGEQLQHKCTKDYKYIKK